MLSFVVVSFVSLFCVRFPFFPLLLPFYCSWMTMQDAADTTTPNGFSSGRDWIEAMFYKASSIGFNVFRVFFQGDETYLWGQDGGLNSTMTDAADWLLETASKYDIRLIVILNSLWKPDGVPLFEEQCGSNTDYTQPAPEVDPRSDLSLALDRIQTPYKWLTDSGCQSKFQAYLKAVITRTNARTGVPYASDPTILSWELLNEPRCMYCKYNYVADWYATMAKYVKSIDSMHLVSTGEEGFFSWSSDNSQYNPLYSGTWSSYSGQSFEDDNSPDEIDFATVHIWPDNWEVDMNQLDSFTDSFVNAHANVASNVLGKPVLLEEFGIKVSSDSDVESLRNPWFYKLFNDVLGGATNVSTPYGDAYTTGSTDNIQGAMVWLWQNNNGSRSESLEITNADSTFDNIITPFSLAWNVVEASSLLLNETSIVNTTSGSYTASPANSRRRRLLRE